MVVFAGAETEFGVGDTITYRSRRVVGGGVGAYHALGTNGVLEVLGGFDTGNVRASHDPITFWGDAVEVEVREGRMSRTFGQLDVGIRSPSRIIDDLTVAAAFSLRVSAVRFTDLREWRDGTPQEAPTEERMTVLEPGLIGHFTTGPVRFETGVRFALPHRRPEYVGFEPLRSEVSVSLALDRLFEPKEGRAGPAE
jgi:hypothetical protein